MDKRHITPMTFTSAKHLDSNTANLVLYKLGIKPVGVWTTNDQGKRKMKHTAQLQDGSTIEFRNLAHKKAYAFDGYINQYRCFPSI